MNKIYTSPHDTSQGAPNEKGNTPTNSTKPTPAKPAEGDHRIKRSLDSMSMLGKLEVERLQSAVSAEIKRHALQNLAQE